MTMPKSDGGDAHTGASSVGAPHLVFVHGFLDDSSIWDATVSELGLGPDTVTRVDLVGADADRGRASTVEHLAADVVEVIEKRDGPVVLVGQSMGAQVAELAAAATAERTVALVLVTPVPLSGMRLPDPVAVSFKSLANDYEAQCKARTDLSVALTPEAVKNLAQRGITIPGDIVGALVDAWNLGSAQGNEATRFPGPVLIVRGAGDPFITQEVVAASGHRFPRAQVVTLEGSGHWPHIEQPRALAAAVSQFLTEHVSSSLAVEASPVTKPRS
jgi:pimeloyl-ACP methyl ester carboxylesterase